MESQNQEFLAAYGEVMLFAHLIEDLVAVHIYDCGYFSVNGYSGFSRGKIRKMSHEDRIKQLSKIYPENDQSVVGELATRLDHLRLIRNKLTHAFVTEVGGEFSTEESVDQVVGMLKSILRWQRYCHHVLFEVHKTVWEGAVRHSLPEVMKRDDPELDARVARSEIQRHLDDLEQGAGD